MKRVRDEATDPGSRYMLLIVAGLWLMCGAVSFFSAFLFCRVIYTALKSD
jgi:hypothetical protein